MSHEGLSRRPLGFDNQEELDVLRPKGVQSRPEGGPCRKGRLSLGERGARQRIVSEFACPDFFVEGLNEAFGGKQ